MTPTTTLAIDAGQSSIRARLLTGPQVQHQWDFPPLMNHSSLLPQLVGVVRSVLSEQPVPQVRVAAALSGLTPADAKPEAVLLACKDLGVTTVHLAHDSISGYLSCLGGKRGSAIAAGTGVVALATGEAGYSRVDGWGNIMGDAGSCYWIGKAALDAAIRAHDGRGEPTAILELLQKDFPDVEAAYIEIESNPEGISFVASKADKIIDLSDQDGISARIVDHATDELALSAAASLRGSGWEPESSPYISWAGKILSNPRISDPLRRKLQQAWPNAYLVAPRGEPLDGSPSSRTCRLTTRFTRCCTSPPPNGCTGIAPDRTPHRKDAHMAISDKPLAELVNYRPAVRGPGDFDDFWEATLKEVRTFDLNVRAVPVQMPYETVDIFDVSFSGFAGDRINAWLTVPRGVPGPLPAVVEFIGYNGGRDLPGESLHWASAGYAHLHVDTRGQGAGWGGGGSTNDPHGSSPSVAGFMTRGINDPLEYYYRRVFTDAARAVDAARELPGVNPGQVAVHGISQGGGIALAVSGLVPDLAAVMADVPFLCHFERGVEICTNDPFGEITRYLSVHRGQAESVFNTLSYFDAVNFARRATARTMYSVGLMDVICPPSTVYAAYNHHGSEEKSIINYPFNDHEGGQGHQRKAQMEWLQRCDVL
ncbi:acetylxylan esterase [Arthrobacter sp. SD76]|uniref:acetylxylan esterase n=1 Tax=Arthrobacter sp. SD76 TaxID=3415007 RepID=UPI003C77658D